MSIKLPVSLTGTFIYVDCGSAGDSSTPLLQNFKDARYLGFDPGLKDVLVSEDNSICFPVALAKSTAEMEFHRTHNPNCSSFFQPNHEFLSAFKDIEDFFRVTDTITLKTVALDAYLPQHGVTDIDFIELDTQGAELDILQGGEGFLSSNIIGARVEVEFAEMYQGQPLFGDVDAFLRQFGFRLFDLDRYHLKRVSSPAGINSREQIVWGQAVYLRDFRSLSADPAVLKQKLSKLAVVASHYGFHSYALDVLDYLAQQDGLLDPSEKEAVVNASAAHLSDLESDPFLKWARVLDKPPLRRHFRRWWRAFAKFTDACRFLVERQRYFWMD